MSFTTVIDAALRDVSSGRSLIRTSEFEQLLGDVAAAAPDSLAAAVAAARAGIDSGELMSTAVAADVLLDLRIAASTVGVGA
jgi:hypothetical protein